MELSGAEHQFAVGIIREDKLLYVYPRELMRKELLKNFLNIILLLVESIAGSSNRIVFRIGGRIYAVSRVDSNILFFSGPPEIDDEYASKMLDDLRAYLSRRITSYEQLVEHAELLDTFISSLIKREYAIIKVRRIHPAKIFVVTPLGINAMESGEIKKLNISKQCIKMLKSFSPEIFLGEIIEKIKMTEKEISDCLEILYRKGYIVELPDMYVNTIAVLKMLNIITMKSMALIGRTVVKEAICEILNSMPEGPRKNIVFDDKKLRIDWIYSKIIAQSIKAIEEIREEDYASNMVALKVIIYELLKKFEEIMSRELKEQLDKVIRRELEARLKMSIA